MSAWVLEDLTFNNQKEKVKWTTIFANKFVETEKFLVCDNFVEIETFVDICSIKFSYKIFKTNLQISEVDLETIDRLWH